MRQVSTRRLCNSSIIKLEVLRRWSRTCYIGSNREAVIRQQKLWTKGFSVPVTSCRETKHSWSVQQKEAHVVLTVSQDTLSCRYLSPRFVCASFHLPDLACRVILLRKFNIKTAWLSYEMNSHRLKLQYRQDTMRLSGEGKSLQLENDIESLYAYRTL